MDIINEANAITEYICCPGWIQISLKGGSKIKHFSMFQYVKWAPN